MAKEATWISFAPMNTLLKLKSALVASPLEGVAKTIQWAAGAPFRSSHPELAELFLEEKRLPEVLQRLRNRRTLSMLAATWDHF